MRQTLLAAILLSTVALVATGQSEPVHAGNFVAEDGSDFDCDGIRDSVFGNPYASAGGDSGAGTITVTYGRSGRTQTIHQDTAGVPGGTETSDSFGLVHTSYDRNSDGCDDLVVSTPYEDIGSEENAGMVWYIPGSPSGLDTSRSRGYTQDTGGYPGGVEPFDEFGYSLAAARAADGTPYLLIGTPGETGGDNVLHAGAVYYVGSGPVRTFSQDTAGVAGERQVEDRFGEKLSASDRFLAVGTPCDTLGGNPYGDPPTGCYGMVHVFRTALTSGRPTPVAGLTQDTPGVSGSTESWDKFGAAVSVISYRPAGGTEVGALLATGTWEGVGDRERAGMAHLFYVSPSGEVDQLTAFTQNTPGVTGGAEAYDFLGYDVVLANLDPSAAVATPQTAVWAVAVRAELTADGDRGSVHVLPPGWRRGDSDVWVEDDTHGIPGGSVSGVPRLRASSSHLHIGSYSNCVEVPWRNLLAGASDPVLIRPDDGQ